MKTTKTLIYIEFHGTFEGCGVCGSKEMEPTTIGKKGPLRRNKRPQKTPKVFPRAAKNGPCKERTNEHTFGTKKEAKKAPKMMPKRTSKTDL